MSDPIEALDALVAERHLLTHPFYAKWVEGTLPREALQEYARQYYAFESAFPTFLSAIHARVADRAHRQIILENLWDEEFGADNHAELWLRFAEAVGVPRDEVVAAEPNEATRSLVDTYHRAAAGPEAAGIAALYAYESQVPAVAASKIAGLREHYGVSDGPGIDFFTAHIEADTGHAEGERSLIRELPGTDDEILAEARSALDAWWDFLSAVDPADAGSPAA